MKKILIFLAAFLPIFTFGQTMIGGQTEIVLPTSQWTSIQGLVWLPSGYSTSKKYPLIVAIPGIGEEGTNYSLLTNATEEIAGRLADGTWNGTAINPSDGSNYQFIVITMQGPANSWQPDATALKYILSKDVLPKYSVDTNRIYVTGLSAGGYDTWTIPTFDSLFSKTIAAIAPISAAPIATNLVSTMAASVYNSHLPVMIIIGNAPTESFYANNLSFFNAINALKPSPLAQMITLQNVGHSAWYQAYNPLWTGITYNGKPINLFQWLLTNKRGSSVVVNPTPQPVIDTIYVQSPPVHDTTYIGIPYPVHDTIAVHDTTYCNPDSITLELNGVQIFNKYIMYDKTTSSWMWVDPITGAMTKIDPISLNIDFKVN